MFHRRAVVLGLILALIVAVSGCGKGGSSSGSKTLTLTSISVTSVTVGSSNTTETVTGTNFTSSSVVQWNGTSLTTTFVSSTQLTATVPASLLATAGTFNITVADGGVTSNSLTFTVTSSSPKITSLSPGNTIAGSVGFPLTITGTGFSSTSVIVWNGTDLTTTYLNSTQLNAEISASLVASSAAIPVTVRTPSATGGTSTAQTFNVNAPVPTIAGINPTVVSAGSGGITLTVNGTNFVQNSTVKLAGSNRTTVFVSPTQLTATVPASDLASAATPAITVFNTTPQGGTSNAVNLTVAAQQTPQAPVANAGFDQTVAVGSTVKLNGTGSSDSNGNRLTFAWSLVSRPAGSAAALSNATSPTPSFVADLAGNYSVQLVVNDGTANSAASTVTISTVNSAPVANAGSNQTAQIGTTVQLDGTKSTDFDGNLLTYSWSFVSVPSGSAAAFSSANNPKPTFVVDKPGNYVARLVVNDGTVNSAPSTVTITTGNTAPVASAGWNITVPVAATVHLDGSASSDFDGNPLTYQWTITSVPNGSSAALSSASDIRPTFIADLPGSYLVQLIVNDGTVSSVASTVTVTTVSTPPVAVAGRNRTVSTGTTVQLDGSGSSDIDGNALTYRWALIRRPAGSTAALSSANRIRPAFTADVAGTYVAQLIVSDSQSSSAPSTVTISTTNSAPVANAGTPQSVTAGTTVQLDGTKSTDADGKLLQYSWSLVSKPAASAAYLSSPSVPIPAFVADVAGDYVVQLIVNDAKAYSAPATVIISTLAVRPVANAGKDQLTSVGSTVLFDGSGSDDPNGSSLNYKWSLISAPAGSSAALTAANTAQPTLVPDVPGDYQVQLVVTSSGFTSAPSTVTVSTVYAPPIANPGANQADNVGTAVNLDGGSSQSPSGGPLSYKWALVGMPAGSTAALNNATSQSPSFTIDKRGAYVGQLIVNDGQTDSQPATVTITSTNRAPIANAGANQNAVVGATVTLDGTASTDPDGYQLSYQWRFTSIPSGSSAVLTNNTGSSPTFVADIIGTYTLELVVSDGLLTSTPSTVDVTVGPNTNITLAPSPLAIDANSTGVLTITLGQVAGNGGVTVNLTSSDTNVATVPATVSVASGSSVATAVVTGKLVAGSTTITASATGYTSGSVVVNVSVHALTVPNVTVGKNLQASSTVTLSAAATAAVTVTITSPDTSKVLVSSSATAKGSGSATATVGTGGTTSTAVYIQALTDSGSVTLTAKAPGYTDTTFTVSLAPSGFIIKNGTLGSLNTTTNAADTTLTVYPAYLEAGTLNVVDTQSVRAGMGTVTVKLGDSSTAVGTITPTSITFQDGQLSGTTVFHPLTTGNTDISVTEPSGFSTPAQFQKVPVTVGQPTITLNSVKVGKDLQTQDTVYLSAPAPTGGVDVTVTSSDPSKVVLSTSPTTAGTANVTVHVNAGVQGLPVFYVQGLSDTGGATLTATATNFTDGTADVGLMPSGFLISSGDINSGSSGDSSIALTTSVLQPVTFAPAGIVQAMRPGAGPVSITLNNSNAAVGTVSTPVTFNANEQTATATFHPLASGSTTISLVTPAGFSTPSQYQSITASVGLPGLSTQTAISVGNNLQISNLVTLGSTPANPVSVTITSNAASIAGISSDPTQPGSGTVTFSSVTGSTPRFYIQGISQGTTTLTVSAPGYTSTSIHVAVNPSGFIFGSPSFRVSANTDTTVTVAPAMLDGVNLSFVALQPLRGGLSEQIALSSDNPAAGTITSPVSFAANQSTGTATFHAVADGSSNITLAQPSGFSTPTTYATITASVGLPGLTTTTAMTIGKDLQLMNQVTLGVKPTSAVAVTITSSSASVASISADPTLAGSGSVTFSNITGSTPAFYVQGLSVGTTTLTVSASGYNNATINVTVKPSGFVVTSTGFTTSVGTDTGVGIASALLDTTTLIPLGVQPIRGGLTVSVPVTSSSTATGTVASPISFTGNQGAGGTIFHPVATGTTNITVGTPTGFSTPSANTSITATVQ